MNIEDFREYCLSFPDTHEGQPFDGFFHNAKSILVFYVKEKMFCFFDVDEFDACTIKCDPEKIDNLKAKYAAIGDPFNLSSKYWISVKFNGDVSDKKLKELVRRSYELVVDGLKKSEKEEVLSHQ